MKKESNIRGIYRERV